MASSRNHLDTLASMPDEPVHSSIAQIKPKPTAAPLSGERPLIEYLAVIAVAAVGSSILAGYSLKKRK